MMMKCVANKNTTNQITGRHGLLTKPLKEAMNSAADLPAKLLVAHRRGGGESGNPRHFSALYHVP